MNPRVVIGEDSPVEQKLLEALLRSQPGLEVQVYSDGLELYHEVHRDPPDLIVLDLMLPGLDGFMITRLLKSSSRFQGVMLLCTSSIREDDLEQRVRALGADLFLPKPIHPDRLLQSVRRLLDAPAAAPPRVPVEIALDPDEPIEVMPGTDGRC
ncbi:MAG: response regulator [Armatimonadetes bacterium]|nr:response regulator [Armatimonadota bacterium]